MCHDGSVSNCSYLSMGKCKTIWISHSFTLSVVNEIWYIGEVEVDKQKLAATNMSKSQRFPILTKSGMYKMYEHGELNSKIKKKIRMSVLFKIVSIKELIFQCCTFQQNLVCKGSWQCLMKQWTGYFENGQTATFWIKL